jgi:hypothetical protein
MPPIAPFRRAIRRAAVSSERGADACAQYYWIEGLRQIVLRSGGNATHRAVELVERRDHDNRKMARACIGFEPAQHLEAAQSRHHHIEQYEVEIVGCSDCERRLAAFDRGQGFST